MALAPNTPFNKQLLQDGFYTGATASIAAASPSFDLVQASPFPTTRWFVLNVSSSAISSVSETAFTASVYVQDSADNSTFANVASLGPLVVNDVGTGTASASLASYQLPPTVRRYIRINKPSFNSGTDFTGSVKMSLGF